jgi:WD40 repeat protein
MSVCLNAVMLFIIISNLAIGQVDEEKQLNSRIPVSELSQSGRDSREESISSISFSADDRNLLVMTSGLMNSQKKALIIDLTSKEVKELQFEHLQDVWWLTSDQILFMRSHSAQIPVTLGKLELSTNKLVLLSDSVTFNHLVSPNGKRIAFKTWRDGFETLLCVDLGTGEVKRLLQSKSFLRPKMWSPDENFILVNIGDGDFQRSVVINIKEGTQIALPMVLDNVCGWSADGNRIYQVVTTKNGYIGYSEKQSPTVFDGIVYVEKKQTTTSWSKSEIIEIDLLTITSKTILKKGQEIRAKHSATKNMFIVMIDKTIYLMENTLKRKLTRIIDKCHLVEWSNSGDNIAYVSSKDNQLNVYNVSTGKSEKFYPGNN